METYIRDSKNLLQFYPPEKNKTYRGVTFSANDDGTVTLNGQVVTTGNSLYAITWLNLEDIMASEINQVEKTYIM